MTTVELVKRAESLGATFELVGESANVEAPQPLPDSLISELRQRRSEIIDLLNTRRLATMNEKYSVNFPQNSDIEREMIELERRVKEYGYVLCWSEYLRDFVAFHRNDVRPNKIPPGFVPYSDQELKELFDKGSPDLSESAVKLIHAAKKKGPGFVKKRREE